jgi:DNA mismatch repair protein MutL
MARANQDGAEPMPRIQQLGASIVNKIAAGEVIERPASVVKELLENSVDALANRIDVEIEAGGSERIRIVDDGEGIHPEDLLLSITAHATSKIRTAEDLFGVHTLGFRGEALASIAEVSRFHVRSRTADSVTGMELVVDCGAVGTPQPCGCAVGSSFDITNLFTNTPVRRKFLKRPATEFGHIAEQFTRVALSHPRLHMRLVHNGKDVFDLPPTERLSERLELFYGRELSEGLIWVESETADCRLWGYVGHPSQTKSTRKGQYLFLNGRPISDRSLSHALTEAYRGLVMVGRQPIAFLFLEIDPALVDVNVHPTKSEVRFQDSQQLYRQLLSVIRTTFLGLPLETSLRVDPSGPVSHHARGPADPHQRHLSIDSSRGPHRPFSPHVSSPAVSGSSGPGFPSAGNTTVSVNGPSSSPGGSSPVSSTAESTSPETTTDEGVRALQIHDCYLVLETPEGMTVVDQHALHERILYEQFKQRMLDGEIEQQKLLVPETVELSSREAALVTEHADLLAKLGFGIESFGHNTVVVNSYPSRLRGLNFSELLQDLSDRLEQPEKAPGRRDILDSLLQMMACKAAIKAGHRLASEEIASLLEQRHLIDDAHHCPHGRPTALVLSRAELDRQFGRLG